MLSSLTFLSSADRDLLVFAVVHHVAADTIFVSSPDLGLLVLAAVASFLSVFDFLLKSYFVRFADRVLL